jgi:phosphatidylglycerophosphate synthase
MKWAYLKARKKMTERMTHNTLQPTKPGKKYIYNHLKACKPFEVEELLDIYINRKIAAPVVKLLLNTKITPNQVTIFSLFIGVGGAWLLIKNYPSSPILFALSVYLALIFDCVDGQLARSRDQASLSGRILDGMVDYLNSAAFFIAMVEFTIKNSGMGITSIWIWAVIGALSMFAHSIAHDLYRQNYITYAIKDYPEKNYPTSEINNEYRGAFAHKEYSKIIILTLYLFYIKVQNIFHSQPGENKNQYQYDETFAIIYRRYNRSLIRAWSLIGMSAHLTCFFIASLIAYFDPRGFIWCFAFFITIMNPFMAVLYLLQGRALANCLRRPGKDRR